MLLSNREKSILELLIKSHGQYITIYDIAQQLAVSSRTIHRELKILEQDLLELDLTIARIPNKGIQLEGSQAAIAKLQTDLSNIAALDLTTDEQKLLFYTL